jgi:hypothetical protein
MGIAAGEWCAAIPNKIIISFIVVWRRIKGMLIAFYYFN